MTLFRERVLITGGTGTLGHAIVMKSMRENWGTDFTIFSRSELRLSQMKARFPQIRTVIGDVRDLERLQAVVAGHDGVIHAAALKRIPECETDPRECYLTNIVGSMNVVRACRNVVSWVVGISTDKACQATTTYGASKLLLESIFLAPDQKLSETRFHLVRYGNVVASNGSVVPIWREAFERDLPLPITHTEMTRFWMSPFDAVQTIQNCLKFPPGQIYVPKVQAASMVQLARHLFRGCRFQVIGLRSTEKLHESLVGPDELSDDGENHILITPSGTSGLEYRSDSARELSFQEFSRMLQEAEEVEK